MVLGSPSPLADDHRLENFRCASPELASWLIHRARKNHQAGASRCFVVCDERRDVIGYYALAAGSVTHDQVPGSVKRNMPEPIPVAVLGRLAVHAEWLRGGIGQGLLKDAVLRTLRAAEHLGIRALLCHAIDDDAKAFYRKHGFIESPIDPLTLMLSMKHLGNGGPIDLRVSGP